MRRGDNLYHAGSASRMWRGDVHARVRQLLPQGVLTMRGCIGTIDDQKGARKMHIGFDFSANNGHGAGTAALFLNGSTNPKCSITDQSMAGNACVCSNAPPQAVEK